MKIKKTVSLLLITLISCALILPSFAGCSNKTDTGSTTTASAADNGTTIAAGNAADTTTTETNETTEATPAAAPIATEAADMSAYKSFVTEAYTGERNNYNGSVGYEFLCNADMTVTAVGRPLNGQMLDTHTIYIWDVASQTLVAQADVTPESPLDALGFKVATLSNPVTLKSGSSYRIVSAEMKGGDMWFDVGTTAGAVPGLITTSDCTITTPAFGAEDGYDSYPSNVYTPGSEGDNLGYVGMTFYYTLN